MAHIDPLQFFFADDRKTIGSLQIFRPLAKAFNEIAGEEVDKMIPIQHKSIHYVRVVPFVLEGDNKSIHEAGGFVESFLASHPCVHCYSHQDELRIMFKLNESQNRTLTEYHLNLIDVDVTETGVTGPSAFSEIHGFNVIDNIGPDIFHDMPEGVEKLEFAQSLEYFVKKGFTSLDQFNRRLELFEFDFTVKNKPD